MDRSEPFPARLALTSLVFFIYQRTSSHGDDHFASVDIGQGQINEDSFERRFATMDIGCGISNSILTISLFYNFAMCSEDEANELLYKWLGCLTEILEFGASNADKRNTLNRKHPPRVQIPTSVQSSSDPFFKGRIHCASDRYATKLGPYKLGIWNFYRVLQILRGSIYSGLLMVAGSRVVGKYAAFRFIFILYDARDSESKEDIFQVILTPEHQPPMLITNSEIDCAPKFDYGKSTIQSYLHQDNDGF